jgi:hypothetical protein
MLRSFAWVLGHLKTYLKDCALMLSLLWKEVIDMAMVYATLIIKGRRSYDTVPETLKAQVREILIDCDCGHLCGETEE